MKLNWCPTLELLQLCITLVARAAIIALTLICFLLIGLGLDQVIKFAIQVLDASPSISESLSQITLLYVLLIGSAGTLTGMVVVVFLIVEDLRNTISGGKDAENGGDSE